MKVDRVVAALHPCALPRTEFGALAKRAGSMDAELIGLFIEDIDLLHFAAMPFACEIGSASARPRTVDAHAMERYMRSRAQELRDALTAVLGSSSVPWSFRVARGTVADELLAAGIERPGCALLLPPGADIERSPWILKRSECEQFRLHFAAHSVEPILLLGADESR